MTKASFALFVQHFKEQTRKLHGTHKVVLIADKASAHQGVICEQHGIYFEPLPTACPELSPVERFFEEWRKEFSNGAFTSQRKPENYLCKILKKYFAHPEALVQLCHYPYIRNA